MHVSEHYRQIDITTDRQTKIIDMRLDYASVKHKKCQFSIICTLVYADPYFSYIHNIDVFLR